MECQASREERRDAKDGEKEKRVSKRVHSCWRLYVLAQRVKLPKVDSRAGREHRRDVTSQNYAERDETVHVFTPMCSGPVMRRVGRLMSKRSGAPLVARPVERNDRSSRTMKRGQFRLSISSLIGSGSSPRSRLLITSS